jgi:hypothetical protein
MCCDSKNFRLIIFIVLFWSPILYLFETKLVRSIDHDIFSMARSSSSHQLYVLRLGVKLKHEIITYKINPLITT